jgi:hypothetical protein
MRCILMGDQLNRAETEFRGAEQTVRRLNAQAPLPACVGILA